MSDGQCATFDRGEKTIFQSWLQSDTLYGDAAISSSTINTMIRYGNSAHVGDGCKWYCRQNFALTFAAKPLQTETWLPLTASSPPHPTVPSPNSYDMPFSRNTYVRDDRQTTACAIGTTVGTVDQKLANWVAI